MAVTSSDPLFLFAVRYYTPLVHFAVPLTILAQIMYPYALLSQSSPFLVAVDS
jgi:hypothetical protein